MTKGGSNLTKTATSGVVDAALNADAYLTERQFCDRYHVAPRTVQRWRVTGQGPLWVRVGPHKIAYRLSDVERWTRSRTYSNRADELSQACTLSPHGRPQ